MKKKCKHCNKIKELAKNYIICFDCLIYLDINHLNYTQYEKEVHEKTI